MARLGKVTEISRLDVPTSGLLPVVLDDETSTAARCAVCESSILLESVSLEDFQERFLRFAARMIPSIM